MPFSSRTTITFAALLTLIVMQGMIHLALSMPRMDISFQPVEQKDTGLQVVSVASDGPNAGRLFPGDTVATFLLPDGEIEAMASLLVEEPDTLPDYRSYNRFLREQHALANGLGKGDLTVRLTDGRQVELSSREGRLRDLPFMFWFQLFVGAAGVMTAAIVLALAQKSGATVLYALTGFGYLVFAPAAAVYSTRELALDVVTFRMLSVVNHFGALFFTASLTALLWMYPRPLGSWRIVMLCYLVALVCWIVDTIQLMETPMVFHLGVLGIFLASLIFAVWQWVRTQKLPADRAALRWFLLSIYLATGLFAGTIIIPAAFNLPLPASQGVMFGAFLIMYWGLALGVVRYRLFQLEEWWYSIWVWFLSGVAVVVLDVLLLGLLDIEAGTALTLSVAVIGWLYFPMRQWLWEKLGRTPARDMQDWLPAMLPLLIQLPEGDDGERQLQARWPAMLATVFSPLRVENDAPGVRPGPLILDEGLALRVPSVQAGGAPLVLRHADGGRRLFTRHDVATLSALRRLFDLAQNLLRAHETGVETERARIARDIHDDLGAKLLSLLYRSREEDQPLVRDAIMCTRELVSTLNLTPVSLAVALTRWRAELHERLDPAKVALEWVVMKGDPAAVMLSARQNANITRILRESVTNALKHAGAGTLRLEWQIAEASLHLSVHDNGVGMSHAVSVSGGRGMAIMRARAEELGGTVEWGIPLAAGQGRGCEVRVYLPLEVMAQVRVTGAEKAEGSACVSGSGDDACAVPVETAS